MTWGRGRWSVITSSVSMGTDLSDGNGHQRDSYSVGPYQGALLRGVTEGGGGVGEEGGIFPLLPKAWPLATFIGNKRKIEPKDKPRSSIPCLPAVYSPVLLMVSYPSVLRLLLLLCFPLAFCYNI